MANYNNGHFITTAVKSVLSQTLRSWELIIVDDCSTDDSVSVIETLAASDERIRFFKNNRNHGVGYTKRRAVAECRGEIVGILDPDDAIAENALEIMSLAHFENPTTALCWSEYWLCDAELKPIEKSASIFRGDNNMGYMLAKPGDIHHFWCFKRGSYVRTEGFMERLRLAEDQDLFYKLEEVGATRNIQAPLYFYRHHSGSISNGIQVPKSFALHLLVMCDALKRRKRILPKEDLALQHDAVLGHCNDFVDWGVTKIDLFLVARLQRSINSVMLRGMKERALQKALKYRVKKVLSSFL